METTLVDLCLKQIRDKETLKWLKRYESIHAKMCQMFTWQQQIDLLDEVRHYWEVPNKQLEFQGFYLNSQEHGQHTYWFINGLMQERINYLYGKRHGIYRAWYLNGAIHIEANYHHGVLHGEYRAWCYTETLLEHSNYSLGELAE